VGALLVDVILAQVDDLDTQTLAEERHLTEPGSQRFVVEVGGLEDVGAGEKSDGRTGLVGLVQLLHRAVRHPQGEALPPMVPVPAHVGDHPGAQRVHHRTTHTMQAAGHLVTACPELATGVQHRQHQRQRRNTLSRVDSHRDTAAVVDDPTSAAVDQLDFDVIAIAGQGLVHRVVDDLIDQMVQAALPGGADIHAGTLANRLQPLKHLDL